MKTPLLLTIIIITSLASIATAYVPSSDHLGNPSPDYQEDDVSIGPKGVQTCIDITIDSGCSANVTFEWFNWSQAYDHYLATGEFDLYNDTFWHTYGTQNNVNASTTICFWNANVSCSTEYWHTWYFDWRVTANFTCAGQSYNETYYIYFRPEDCPLFHIKPTWNSTEECPCCINLCIGITNKDGHTMNATFYSNLSGQWDYFYLGTINRTLTFLENGTYCIQVPHFSEYNHTYYWYVNITDTVTGDYNVSDTFSFRTATYEECMEEEDETYQLQLETDRTTYVGLLGGLIVIPALYIFMKRRKH